jgi:cytochrome oxidase Cu insertion factor (SCO1/SenC/PrrC family)
MSESMNANAEERRKIRRGRLVLVLIALVFVVPLLAAIWLQRVAFKEGVWGTTNHGTLIQPPRALQDFRLPSQAGSAFTLENLRGKWTLLYAAPSAAECDAQCKQMLYYMRQIRLALNGDMDRVQRVLLAAPESAWLQDIAGEYAGMHIVFDSDGPASLQQQLAPPPAQISRGLYLIDPLGYAMMIFPPQTDPRDILKDIKRLLKISKVD